MTNRYRIPAFILSCIVLLVSGLLTGGKLHAQSYVSEAESNGFTLKKVVSDTAIATGQNFSYTIYFSIPAGATSVTITDMLPPMLAFQSISVTSACGSPTVSAPPTGTTNGTVSLTWASVPSGCSGSFVITVNFPNGITCNGSSARNRVCLTGEILGMATDFCTPYLSTMAIAEDPWNVGKWILDAGSQSGPCNKVTADSVVTYRICVWKDVGTTGQLNMENAMVYDTLPAGAMLVPGSSTCTGMTQTGNVISWNIGSLSALPMYNTQCCTFDVLYPTAIFPTGSQITNRASLEGVLGSLNNPCGQAAHLSNETCVEIKQVTSATFSKYVYTNGQPGCDGKYRIWLCNNGSLPIDSLTITDTIPTSLTGLALGASSSGLSPVLTGNILTVNLSSPLLPTQCRYVDIEFTIPATATPGSTITNCAYITIPGTPPREACASFDVNAPEAKPCIWKEVCNLQPSYSPGDVFRYRLRVQNIGGLPITGATITDVLDPNLAYAGNLATYTASSWSAPCQTTSNWSGVSLTQTGNTLDFTLPVIPADCQDLFYNYCGMYGNSSVPYYYIEFDVMVTDTSALGNIPNNFSIAGGNLTTTTTSNTAHVNVVGTTGFFLEKSVAPDTTSWSPMMTTTAGSTVNYQLQLTVAPGSVGLRHVTFADLLPLDDAPNDVTILGPCAPRGSIFDLSFASTLSTAPAAAEYNNPASMADVDIFTPAGAPGAMFTGGCGTAGSWLPGLSPGALNLGYYFGSTPIGAGNSATAVLSVNVPASALESDSACNTFAANGAVRHLINSSVISDQQTGSLESGPACVHISEQTGGKDTCVSIKAESVVSSGVDPTGNCTYTIILSTNNPASTPAAVWLDSDQGSIAPSALTAPSGAGTFTIVFTDTPAADSIACIRYGIFSQQQQRILCDSVCFDLPPCDVEEDPCDSIRVLQAGATSTGVGATGDCTYNINLVLSNSGSTATSMWFDTDAGSLTPNVLSVAPGTTSGTLSFTDTAPPDSFICIRYGYFSLNQERILCDSICFDLPPCEQEQPPCDSLINGMLDEDCCEYDVTIVNAVGTPITSISYYVTGGTLDALTTAPCAPVSPPTAGTTSGILTYAPPCAGSLGMSFQGTPSTPGGNITVTLVIHHGDKDSCSVRFSYECKEEQHGEPIECDKVKVKPFLFTGLDLSGRTFVVSNTKVPSSPITHIDINPVPVPCFLQGGALRVDFVPTAWGIPYTRIPVTGFISANTQVKFNLGVDYTCGWTGTINLVIHHADGDSCVYSYGPWDASPPTIGGGVISTTGIDKKVFANRLRLENTSGSKSVKWISVHAESDSTIIIAGSGDHWEGTMLESGDARLDGYEQGRHEALFSLETPVPPNGTSDYFNLVVARDTMFTDPPVIRWITYDENGEAIGTDTVRITTPVLSIRGEGTAPAPGDFSLLQSFPSPAQGTATINYTLGRDLSVRLELYDALGQFVETVDEGFRLRGMQSLTYGTAHLPAGTYYLKLSSGDQQVIRPLVIMR
ncbi:T9SS type A sorting domain-containing protein [bacterium]|nr:T9SS type A sorting domain-containing protein [bacterium]